MILEQKKRPVVLFYSLTERDRVVAEQLGAKLGGYVVRHSGPTYDRGYFGLCKENAVYGKPSTLSHLAELHKSSLLCERHKLISETGVRLLKTSEAMASLQKVQTLSNSPQLNDRERRKSANHECRAAITKEKSRARRQGLRSSRKEQAPRRRTGRALLALVLLSIFKAILSVANFVKPRLPSAVMRQTTVLFRFVDGLTKQVLRTARLLTQVVARSGYTMIRRTYVHWREVKGQLKVQSRRFWLASYLLQCMEMSEFGAVLLRYFRWRHLAKKLVLEAKADCLVLFEESAEGMTRVLASVAWAMRTPYLVIPQTIPNPKEAAQFCQSLPEYDGRRLTARIAGMILPKWRYVFEGRPLIRLPVNHIVAQHLLNLAPRSPWILNHGHARAVIAECEVMYEKYRSLGFSRNELVLCGHPVDDILYATRARRADALKELEQKLGMIPGRPLVVVGFPPDQYPLPDTSNFEHSDFETMCKAWAQGLACMRGHANLVIRPHPRLNSSRLWHLRDIGHVVSDVPTETLIPLCDLYVASVSATIRWALGLGVPVINYDCYRCRWNDYEEAAGVTTVENYSEFAKALCDAIGKSSLAESARALAEANSNRWGMMDGRFVDRFETVLNGVLSRNIIDDNSLGAAGAKVV